MHRDQGGFTLIELLVVILIIAILAAIAIPVFLAQRERGWEAQMRSALRNVYTALESHGVSNNGDYSALDDYEADSDGGATLQALGFQVPDWARPPGGFLRIEADTQRFCVRMRHTNLNGTGNSWVAASIDSFEGAPDISSTCPSL